jgi:gliding motility-associated-like protein
MKLLKKLLIIFLLITGRAFAQVPVTASSTPNIGFEDGTFTNWECFIGGINSLGVIVVSPTAPVYDRQTLYGKESKGVNDPYGNFPVLCPNGSNYSMRLGNSSTGSQAERVTYTFTVPAGVNYSLIFNYAVVLQNPNHPPYQQPKFTAQVFNVTDGTYIDCPSFDFVASSGLPGFKLSTAPGALGTSIYYKEWSTATIDLRGYSGKTLRLEFTTNDCTLNGHFGYAYLDFNENTESPITGNAYCLGQKSLTLYAPNGFAGYNWYTADFSKQIGSGQSIKISPAPPNLTKYALVISPYLGLGCVDTLYTTVNAINEGFTLKLKDTIYGCPGGTVDLTAASVTDGSSPNTTFSYFRDSLATTYLYNPDAVDANGTYYIQGVNKEGCMNILPLQVIFSKPFIKVTNPIPVVFPITVDLSKTFTPVYGFTYGYYTDTACTSPVDNYHAVKFAGKFYIKAENSTGCDTIAPVTVLIHPPAPYTITAPNAFTPNNDGINDHFNLEISGYLVFESLRIYARSGQLVYTGKSLEDYWDGTYNGQNILGGAYYWIFEGMDNYNNVKVTKSGNINLIR